MKKSLFYFSVFITSFLNSALPPLYEDIAEIEAILKADKIGTVLDSGEMLLSIEKQEGGYKITGSKHKAFAKVNYSKEQKIGPATFNVEVSLIP